MDMVNTSRRLSSAIQEAGTSISNIMPHVGSSFFHIATTLDSETNLTVMKELDLLVQGKHPNQIRTNHLLRLLGQKEIDFELKLPVNLNPITTNDIEENFLEFPFILSDEKIRELQDKGIEKRGAEFYKVYVFKTDVWEVNVEVKMYRYSNYKHRGSISASVTELKYMSSPMINSYGFNTDYFITKFALEFGFTRRHKDTIMHRIAEAYAERGDLNSSLQYIKNKY